MKLTLGLIGGIGSGKSLVGSILAELGGHVIEGDKLGHEALQQPAIREQVVERWGRDILDDRGEVNRRKLGAIVFADPNERRTLEKLVFPHIERRIEEEIKKADHDPKIKFAVLDAAIMLEAGWSRSCTVVIYVDAPPEQRYERLAKQRGWTAKEVEARENAQLSLEEKKARADAVVDNSGDPAQTRLHVEQLLKRFSIFD